MIITVYNIKESWIFTHENKPSLQLFNTILNNSTTSTVTAQFVEHPNNFNINVRMSDNDVFAYNWNLIKLNDNVYYKVTDVQILQEKSSSTPNTIINVNAEIDLYLSYVVNLFDENSTNSIPVFFIQKHLNRYYYDSTNGINYVNFEQQFYLKNKHENLEDIGVNLAKAIDIYNNSNYNNNISGLSSPLMNYSTGSSYVYALCKFSNNAMDFQNIFTTSIVSNEQLPNLGMINIGHTWKQYNLTYDPSDGPNILQATLTVPWFYFFKCVPSDVCIDYIVYPCPIENALVYKNGSFSQIYTTNPNNINFWMGDGYLVAANATSVLSTTDNTFWPNFAMWLVNPQNLYYFSKVSSNNGFTQFSNIFIEPYLIQYCKFRIRGAGEDSFVDLTFFNNITPNTFLTTLYSFCINQNHPVTQITNIASTLTNQYFGQKNCMQPYAYNNINDAYFCLNWKASYPSSSNNWSNYLMNNLNEYHTALNIAHFGLQQAQANIAFGAIGGLFGGISLKSAVGSTAGITSAIFNEEMQQQSYNYLKTGKREDMSRVSNERLATNNNVISYYNYLLSFVFEYPVQYEQLLATNYCILNGYVLKRWDQFNYWNNRQYVNYVKIDWFSDCLLSGLIFSYKKQIDQMMIDGIRIWNNAYYSFASPTLNIQRVLGSYQNYMNSENNLNNNEIESLQNE